MKTTTRFTIIAAVFLGAHATTAVHAGTIESLAGQVALEDNPLRIPDLTPLTVPTDYLDHKRSLLDDQALKEGLIPIGPPPPRAHADLPDFPEARSKQRKPIPSLNLNVLDAFLVDLGEHAVFNNGIRFAGEADLLDSVGIPPDEYWLSGTNVGRIKSTELGDRITTKFFKQGNATLGSISAVPTPGSGLIAVLSVGLLSGRRRR